MKYIEINACAKINLGLNIVSKREDGYHNLETVFYPIRDLHDKIYIKLSDKFSFSCDNKIIESEENNLLVSPVKKLENIAKQKFNVEIECKKQIPIGAGLGGGSSDAAAVIVSLNDMFKLNLTTEQMQKVALEIGSDVPFFIKAKPSYATGRGEILELLNFYLDYPILLINPGIHISTKEAFANVIPKTSDFCLKDLFKSDNIDFEKWRQFLKNDFETSVFAKYPLLAYIKKSLYQHGALFSAMSGSGSTIYAIFSDVNSALKAKENFPKEYFIFLNLP